LEPPERLETQNGRCFSRSPAWADHQVVYQRELQGALALAVDGYEQYLVRLNLNGPPATALVPAGSPPIAYTPEQPVPDNWIPRVPVQTPEGALMFRRGTMEIPRRAASSSSSRTPASSIPACRTS
jgi:hypothetical protein